VFESPLEQPGMMFMCDIFTKFVIF